MKINKSFVVIHAIQNYSQHVIDLYGIYAIVLPDQCDCLNRYLTKEVVVYIEEYLYNTMEKV